MPLALYGYVCPDGAENTGIHKSCVSFLYIQSYRVYSTNCQNFKVACDSNLPLEHAHSILDIFKCTCPIKYKRDTIFENTEIKTNTVEFYLLTVLSMGFDK